METADNRLGQMVPGSPPADFVAQLRAGNGAAFETLVRSHIARLRATARRLLIDPAAADDAVQEAFLAAFASMRTFRGDADIGTWLHRITVNACLAALRRRRPFDSARADEEVERWLPRFIRDGHRADATPAWEESVDELLARAEIRALVRRSIDALPEPHRTILVLRDLEELTTREAADALELKPNAVKVRLHRARQALRSMLQVGMAQATA